MEAVSNFIALKCLEMRPWNVLCRYCYVMPPIGNVVFAFVCV